MKRIKRKFIFYIRMKRIKRIAMPKAKSQEQCRPRNLRWPVRVDELAVNLAFEKKLKGGVSELITRLVIAESKRKRGIAHLHTPPARSHSGASPKTKSVKTS